MKRAAFARPTGADLHDLTMHYQPIVSATTGRLVAVEALARIPSADGSFGSAVSLITAAEADGRSFALDRIAVTQVLEQTIAWRAIGLPIPVHVNVSAATLSAHDADQFVAWLKTLELDTAALTIEITESVQYDDVDRFAAIVDGCRGAGVEVAIDDFGCGYSTMALLQSVRADVLKIDRRFIAPLLTDARTRVLVRHFIEIAHDLEMRVIAEGVEDPRQGAWLVRNGCDELQGFALARPMAPDALRTWALHRRANPSLPA